MQKKDLKVGEIYAYSHNLESSPYAGQPSPVKLLAIDEPNPMWRRYQGGQPNGHRVARVDEDTHEIIGRERYVTSRELWRTWADQVPIEAEKARLDAEHKARNRTQAEIRREQHRQNWESLNALLPNDLPNTVKWARLNEGTTMRLTAAELLTIVSGAIEKENDRRDLDDEEYRHG